MRFRLSVLIALIAAIVASAPAASAKVLPASCRNGGVVARSSEAILFTRGVDLFGCARDRPRVRRVASASLPWEVGWWGWDVPVLRGTLAAFGSFSYWHCSTYQVNVVDVATLRVVRQAYAGTATSESPASGCDNYGTGRVRSIALRRDGTLAFIAGQPGDYEVAVLDASGLRSLARASDIDPLSIQRQGDTVSWWQQGSRRSAAFAG